MSNWQKANLFISGLMLGCFLMNLTSGRPWWAVGNLILCVINLSSALSGESE